MAIHVLDNYYLSITLLVTIAYQLLGFFIAWTLQFDKITDFTGGSNFFWLALLTLLLGGTYDARRVVASVLVMVWATRLAGFLLFRVLKMGSDTRFDDIRSHFLKFAGFWTGQILWIWTVSLPLTILNSPSVSSSPNPRFGTGLDIAGIIIWVLGWLIETVGDAQKFYYKSTNPPKDRPMAYGIWAWCRHPPYFGEMLCWWGIWLLTISPAAHGSIPESAKRALYGAVVSPLFTMLLLMFLSGLPTAEKPTARKFYLLSHPPSGPPLSASAWPAYQSYLSRTSILLPLPPALYAPLPQWLKRSVLLDWGVWRFSERDGERARGEEGERLVRNGA